MTEVPCDRIVVDGMNLLYRSAYAHPDLSVELQGGFFYTGGLYGAIYDLLRLRHQYDAPVEICWEGQN